MNPPRIGVSGVLRHWHDAHRAGVNAAYVRAVAGAGGVPLILSQLMEPAHVGAALDACDGLLLTGGEDVDPEHYGEAPSPKLGTVDRERDRFELALFAAARARGLPVLGICRGIQLINVALGGTLYQDLPSERPGAVNHDPRPAARHARTHYVRLAPGSRAAQVLGVDRLVPNSFHHQAVKELAPGLVATAWSDDGLIEAVEGAEAPWLLAVQWHPEEMHQDLTAPELKLFRALVDEAGRAVGSTQ
jgi:putative glutamine amidotransferase